MKVELHGGLEPMVVESHNNQLCDIISPRRQWDGQDVDAGPEDGKRSFNFRCKIICRQN